MDRDPPGQHLTLFLPSEVCWVGSKGRAALVSCKDGTRISVGSISDFAVFLIFLVFFAGLVALGPLCGDAGATSTSTLSSMESPLEGTPRIIRRIFSLTAGGKFPEQSVIMRGVRVTCRSFIMISISVIIAHCKHNLRLVHDMSKIGGHGRAWQGRAGHGMA